MNIQSVKKGENAYWAYEFNWQPHSISLYRCIKCYQPWEPMYHKNTSTPCECLIMYLHSNSLNISGISLLTQQEQWVNIGLICMSFHKQY